MFKIYQNTFFLTATINDWKPLLINDEYKNIVLSSLRFLVNEQRVKIFGFVIMPNHIHLIWHISNEITKNHTQGSLLRFTAQQLKFELIKNAPLFLEEFKVNLKDRKYQLWKRNPLSIEIYTDAILEQKLNYVHNNPLSKKWNLALQPKDYFYSSALFYETGIDNFGFLSNYILE